MSAEWGKLSCSILVQDWDSALEELAKLRREIDETVSPYWIISLCWGGRELR